MTEKEIYEAFKRMLETETIELHKQQGKVELLTLFVNQLRKNYDGTTKSRQTADI